MAILHFFGCKKEQEKPVLSKSVLKSLAKDSVGSGVNRTIDTVYFNYNEDKTLNDYALISYLSKKYNEDSTSTAMVKIDFMCKKTLVYSHDFKIKNIDNGAQWYENLELDSISSPLKTITLGYPACGYLQQNFLFYINPKSKSNLIHQWESVSDSGWGNWSQIIAGTPEEFIFRSESFSPKDDASEDVGVLEYSDSIKFKLTNNQWTKVYKTPKGKVYRSEVKSFEEFHDQ